MAPDRKTSKRDHATILNKQNLLEESVETTDLHTGIFLTSYFRYEKLAALAAAAPMQWGIDDQEGSDQVCIGNQILHL